MTDRMTGHFPHAEVLSEPQRRRRWTPAQKLSMVQETYEPDITVSLAARRHGVQPNQRFASRELASQGALTGTSALPIRGRLSEPCTISMPPDDSASGRRSEASRPLRYGRFELPSRPGGPSMSAKSTRRCVQSICPTTQPRSAGP